MKKSDIETAVITAAAMTVYEHIHRPVALKRLRTHVLIGGIPVTIANGYATATDNVVVHRLHMEPMRPPMLLIDAVFGDRITIDEIVKFSLKDLTTEKIIL